MWSARPNEPLRTNCQWCGEFDGPSHLCAQKHDAQLRQQQESTAVKAATEAEAQFRRRREAAEIAQDAHARADSLGRLNVELAKLAGMSPGAFRARQSELDAKIRGR